MRRSISKELGLSLELPQDWIVALKGKFFCTDAPDDSIAVTISACDKAGATVEAFALSSLSAAARAMPWCSPVTDITLWNLPCGRVVAQEYEGVWPGEHEPTYSIVACVECGETFIRVRFTTSREVITARRNLCDRILSSLRKD